MSKPSRAFGHFAIILGLTGGLVVAAQTLSPRPAFIPVQGQQSQSKSGIVVRVFCVKKIYETPCGVGGVIVKTVDDDEIIRQTTDSTGTFQVPLKPGDYKIIPMAGSPEYPVVNTEPRRVPVTEGKFTEVKISYQDGRR